MKTKKELKKIEKKKENAAMKDRIMARITSNIFTNYFKRRKRKLKEKIWEWYIRKYRFHDILMINMELSSGKHRTIAVIENKDGFKYRGNKYIFDPDLKYYNVDFGFYCYDYHEKISLPYRRVFPVNDIKTSLEAAPFVETEYMINPSTLERFETSKIAEGIMKGQQLDEFMKKVIVILFIIMIVTIIHALLFIQKTGMLKSMNIGF